MRYLIRRLRKVMPLAIFLACFWMLGDDRDKVEEWVQAVGADFGATSLVEATAIIVAQARSPKTQTDTNIAEPRKPPLEETPVAFA